MAGRVVCVFLIQGLLVNAFPTSDIDDSEGVLIEVPISGVAEFSGTAPATGSVTIVGHAPCVEFLPASSNPNLPILPQTVEEGDATTFTEIEEPSPSEFLENDEMNRHPIPKKVILGAILADSIMAEKGAEIDAKLAELDAFVETELGTIGPIIQGALTNADISEVDSCVDSALLEVESQISSELAMLDEFLESELAGTEELVESVIRNVEADTIIIPDDVQIVNIDSVASTKRDALIESQLAMLESFVESTLETTEALVESELEKVDALVESELEKVESVVESELAKVDLFIEKELEKTDAVVKSEVFKMQSFVEEELANVEKNLEEIADCVAASSDPILTVSNSYETNKDQVHTVVIDGTFPVSGRTVIIGSTGCPPIFPTGEPLPIYVESFPVFDADNETYEPEIVSEDSEDIRQDDGCVFEVPMKGEVEFSGLAHAVGSCKILGACSCDYLLPLINSNIFPPTVGNASPIIPLKQASGPYNTQYFSTMENDKPKEIEPVLYRKTQLPVVILSDRLRAGQPIVLKGEVEFSGKADADGGASISAHFPCPPLTATEVGPDGKKYIWIAKKPCNKASCQLPKPKPEYPTYTTDFPATDDDR